MNKCINNNIVQVLEVRLMVVPVTRQRIAEHDLNRLIINIWITREMKKVKSGGSISFMSHSNKIWDSLENDNFEFYITVTTSNYY